MTKMPSLTILPDTDSTLAGLFTLWSLQGNVDLDDLRDRWDETGLGEILQPELPSAQVALRRALDEQSSKRLLVRPLDQRGAWELVQETVIRPDDPTVQSGLSYELVLQASLLPDKTISFRAQPGNEALVSQIDKSFRRYKLTLTRDDVSGWLSYLAKTLGGTPLRDRGGVYFIPADVAPTWRKVAGLLGELSRSNVFMAPAVRTEDTVGMVLAALRNEAQEALADVESELQQPKVLAEGQSVRGRNSRARAVEAVRAKLKRYTEQLGAALPDLEARAETLAGAVQAVKLVAKAAADEAPSA